MIEQALHSLNRMLEALRREASSDSDQDLDLSADDLTAAVESTRSKLMLLNYHRTFIENMDWEQLHVAGRYGSEDCQVICGNKDGISVTITDYHAGQLMVVAAFDGLVAGCVNVVDTLARMINRAYRLKIPERQANLLEVIARAPEGSLVGRALREPPGCDWMGPIRKLRGECQHSNVAEVMQRPLGSFGLSPGEPRVSDRFLPPDFSDGRISTFAATITQRTADLIKNIATASASAPGTAIPTSRGA